MAKGDWETALEMALAGARDDYKDAQKAYANAVQDLATKNTAERVAVKHAKRVLMQAGRHVLRAELRLENTRALELARAAAE